MTATVATSTDHTPDAGLVLAGHHIHWNWLALWALLSGFAAFEVVKHGFVNDSAADAGALTATAFGCFIAPDLTFLVGIGQPAQKGHLPVRAVPWYNAMHRFAVPLIATSMIGVALAPLTTTSLALFVGGLSWMAHIALDRATGYGLRNADGSRSEA